MRVRAPDREAVATIRIMEPTPIGRILITAEANDSPNEGTFKITVSYPAEGVDPHDGVLEEACEMDVLSVRKLRRWYFKNDEVVAQAVTELKNARFKYRKENLSPNTAEDDHE